MLSGRGPEWLQPFIERLDFPTTPWQPVDLQRHCTYLGADLSWSGSYDDTDLFAADWDQRSCKSKECPEIDRCPFHISRPTALAESLNRLLEIAVSMRCLGSGQFVGRSRYVTHYLPFLSDLGIRPDNPLVRLLTLLGKRGLVVGYQWILSNDGINGWLDPWETSELCGRLSELPLPRYDASFEVMEGFRRPHPLLYEKFGIVSYEHPSSSFEALSLSFIRTVAAIASCENKGLLWGNDVLPGRAYADIYLKPNAPRP